MITPIHGGGSDKSSPIQYPRTIISNFDLFSDILVYTFATIHFIIFYYVFVLHILLYPFVISCVQILYSQLSLHLPRENSELPLASLRHQSYVKYIADAFCKHMLN